MTPHVPAELFYAEAGTYEQFHAALRRRAEMLQVSRTTIDAETLMADGYASKCLAPKPSKGVITRLALEPMLKALGLRLVVVSDQNTPAGRGELPKRNARQVRSGHCWKNGKRKRTKPKAKSACVKRPAKPRRGSPYLSELVSRGRRAA